MLYLEQYAIALELYITMNCAATRVTLFAKKQSPRQAKVA